MMKQYISSLFVALLLCTSVLPVHAEEIGTETDRDPVYSLGDVNGDGRCNASDAAIILIESALRGSGSEKSFTDEQDIAADLDENGLVNAADAANLLIYAASVGAGSKLTITDYVYQRRLPVSPQVLPAFSGEPYTIVNNGEPFFLISDYNVSESFEIYSEFDSLGRCQVCVANIGQDIMPTEERSEIGMVQPTGWHTIRYDGIVEGSYLYNRCHLIGYQLTGENSNVLNLITGTRYMNVQGMLPFENEVANYVKTTGNHVLYRVTPIFNGDDLVVHGVLMEGYSVEDDGIGMEFCVYCYNVQPGIVIDYPTGDSWLNSEEQPSETTTPTETTTTPIETSLIETPTVSTTATTTTTPQITTTTQTTTTTTTATGGLYYNAAVGVTYVCNTNTKKFHVPHCGEADRISADNRFDVSNNKAEVEAAGYVGCKRCNP